MDVSGPGQEPGREMPRSIRQLFAIRVALPVAGLSVLWVAVVAVTLRDALTAPTSMRHRELLEHSLLAVTGIIVVLAAVLLAAAFARRLGREVASLAAASETADERLPQMVEALRGGEQPATTDRLPEQLPVSTAELARTAAAVTGLQHTAITAAAGEARLRNGLREVFVSLARRNQSLLQRQLRLIDTLEQKASDPAALADLFSLDHLTTRMRRHAESLAILAGAAPGRSWNEPVPVIDVIRGAMAEVEDYQRVVVLTRAEDAVAGPAVADMIHLLAELIENATLFSPSGTRVEVRAERVANGFAIEVDDRGLGIEPAQLDDINKQLAQPPDFDLANADRLGLFVGGKLAARHGIRVSLRPSPYGGTTAIVLMPNGIVAPAAGSGTEPRPALVAGRPAGLDLRPTAALTPQRPAPPLRPPPGSALDGLPQPRRPAAMADGPVLSRQSGPSALDGPRSAAPGSATPGSADPGHPGPGHPGPTGPGPGSFEPAGPGSAAPPAADTYRGLPRRTRQANLSPHLRDVPPAPSHLAASTPGDSPPAEPRTPEHARNLASSLQSGWLRGRADPPDAQDAEAPHSEEA